MKESHPHPTLIQKIIPVSLTLISCSLLVSCGHFDASTLAKKSVKSVKAVTKLIPSRTVPITTVRVKDLQELPTGADRALAWNRHLDHRRFAFFTPKHYNPPKLPSDRGMSADDGLLPSLLPGAGASLDARGELPAE